MTQSSAMARAQAVIAGLLGRGVREAVLSPGSRSGPLALGLSAADAQGLLRLHVRIDEREAAFLALGLAKTSRRPVPVVTTSGTAVVNLHPAVLEAWHAGVEVIAVTADRPARLRGTGANQTTDQRGLLAPVPTVARLDELVPGVPGHLNLEFDEPLIGPWDWEFPRIATPAAQKQFAPEFEVPAAGAETRTVVVAGDGAPAAVADLAARAGWPILAEPSSGVRGAPTAVAAGRLLLGVGQLSERIERVVSVGHATLSRPVTALLTRAEVEVVHLGDASTFPGVAGPNVRFVSWQDLAALPRSPVDWAKEWVTADERVASLMPDHPVFDAARQVWHAAGVGGLLVLGPSQVMRDVDLVAPARVRAPRVLANRGLAGIDGVVSTAVGAALAHGGHTVAFMGDLTFAHGSNGLLLGPQEPRPELTIVVLNDDGGSIFASLEQGADAYASAFERVYATPSGLRIQDVCRAMSVPHRAVTVAELGSALADPLEGIRVLEVRMSRADRRALSEDIARIPHEI